MSTAVHSSTNTAPSLALLNRLKDAFRPRDFQVRFWDGTVLDPEPGQEARFTLVVNHPGALRQMFWPFNYCNVGESYIFGDIDIEGDAVRFIEAMVQLNEWSMKQPIWSRLGIFRRMLALPNQAQLREAHRAARLTGKKHSAMRDEQANQFHYDGSGADFYSLFLDQHMLYTCGYFAHPDEDIDAAQERKLEHICRKLRLKPGERLLDIGCGWAGLITYAAKKFGVQAVGANICPKQIAYGNARIDALGLRDRCRIVHCDSRQLPEDQLYDKVVSVGLIEHLGEKMMPPLFGKIWRLLKPGGVYLHHGITQKPFSPHPPWAPFTWKYIFPDGELVSIPDTLSHLARAGFEIRDVESLREHYAYTLRRWLERLEANRTEAVRLSDEVNYRTFRIYLAGAIYGFRIAVYNVNQTLVVKSSAEFSGLPLSRVDWYS
jgi:cyclopropane-fatty-acyl-phospholipid synthase